MTKFCKNCNTENPDDILVCKNCGQSLPEKTYEGIKIGKKTIFVIFLILIAIIYKLSFKVYDKTIYKIASLPDKERLITVADFKIPQNWVPVGKLVYNPKSIPNMYTFFVAGINPKENVDIQFFSTQYETKNLVDYQVTDEDEIISSEQYLASVLKKLAPTATNVKFVKELKPSLQSYVKAEQEKYLFENLYKENNPNTEKGKSWLERYEIKPVKYLYSYEENGKNFYHLLEGTFVFFIQCFANTPDEDAPVHASVKFIKCEDMFSYQAEASLYEKYLPQYKIFHDSVTINPKWEEKANLARRDKLAEVSYISTNSLEGGDKFKVEEFKNMVFYLEYLDETTKINLRLSYKSDLKNIEKKLSKKFFL